MHTTSPGVGDPGPSLSQQLLVPRAARRVLVAGVAVGLRLLAPLLNRAPLGRADLLFPLPADDRGQNHLGYSPGQLRGEQAQWVPLNVDGDAVMAVGGVVGVDVAEEVDGCPALVVDVVASQDPAEVADVLPS